MSINLGKGKSASGRSISEIEDFIGDKLDSELKLFFLSNDGSSPESNYFPVGGRKYMGGINKFIAASDVLSERIHIDGIGKKAFPIAFSAGGNYVVIDFEKTRGGVYFWDHERHGDMIKISNNFRDFLNLLQPFDASSVKLEPGQVKRVWIDPEFIKKIRD